MSKSFGLRILGGLFFILMISGCATTGDNANYEFMTPSFDFSSVSNAPPIEYLEFQKISGINVQTTMMTIGYDKTMCISARFKNGPLHRIQVPYKSWANQEYLKSIGQNEASKNPDPVLFKSLPYNGLAIFSMENAKTVGSLIEFIRVKENIPSTAPFDGDNNSRKKGYIILKQEDAMSDGWAIRYSIDLKGSVHSLSRNGG